MRTALAITLILLAAPALAAKRLAIVYGHNGGSGPRANLRYAESDAAKVAKVFVETGRVEPNRVRLLQGKPISELFAALEWAKAEAKSDPQTLLLVYLSGHATAADGLLPANEQLPWKELKRRVTATNAKARVTIVDSCQSSGLIDAAAKLAPGFTITADDLLTVQGDAYITSSSAMEPSLEAGQLRGSVFTQHWIAALRGAGDLSNDGKISLDEAYRYAYERTLDGESGQHPGWALRLSGYGDITLGFIREDGPGLIAPTGVERLVLRDPTTRDVAVSIVRPAANKIALGAQTWLVELEREGRRKEGKVEVAPKGYSIVDEGQLSVLARAERLVRLGTDTTCPSIELPERLPALVSLKKSLEPVLAKQCQERLISKVTLTRDETGAFLTLTIGDGQRSLRRPWDEHQRLVDDLSAIE